MTETRKALLADQQSLRRIGAARASTSSAAVTHGYDQADQCIHKWVELAKTRREEAAGSPTDQARWDQIIEAVTRPKRASEVSYEGLCLLVMHLRELLKALIATEPPAVPVAEVSKRIAQRITAGEYAPRSTQSVANTATELRLPLDAVRMALEDLALSGVITPVTVGRFHILKPHTTIDRPRQIADWLKTLMAAEVYPAGSALPPQPELARALVTALRPLTQALRLLCEEGTLARGSNNRPIVQEQPTGSPLAPWRAKPARDVDLSPASIEETARTVHAWWSARYQPHPSDLGRHVDHLCEVSHHLQDQIASRPAAAPQEPHARSAIRRMEVTAAALRQPDAAPDLWRAACLSAAVREVLGIINAEPRRGGVTDRTRTTKQMCDIRMSSPCK